MSEYRVNLDIFSGPLDLLLYLVRKEEVDIYDIPLTKITDQYLRYIEMLKSLDIDLAGDFLVMAATLMQIKSAMLLPKADPELIDTEDLEDPRTELIRQLLEYKKFKDAANLLDVAAGEKRERFARPSTVVDQLKENNEPEVDLDQVSVWDLLESFSSILEATGADVDISHIPDDTPIDLYQIEILHRLQTEGPMKFERVFEPKKERLAMIGFFLALLELIRDRLVWAEQQERKADIYLKALTDEPAEQAVQKAILSSEAEKTAKPEEQKEVPIPITQLPPKRKSSVLADVQGDEKPPISITQLPTKNKSEKPSTQKTEDFTHINADKDTQK